MNLQLCLDTRSHEMRVQTFFLHALNNKIYYFELKVKNLSKESFDVVKKIVNMHTDDYYVMKILSCSTYKDKKFSTEKI